MTLSRTQSMRWTIDDLDGLPENSNRYEIIDGELFVTRSPHLKHQDVIGLVYAALLAWSQQSGLGKPYINSGIVFSESDNVIPDVVWVSTDRLAQILDESGHLTGAPELVVEVLSQTEKDKKRDRNTKLKLYSIEGVTEYWICDWKLKTIEIYQREAGILQKTRTLFATDTLNSPLLPGFECLIETLFV